MAELLLTPHISEKAMSHIEVQQTYVFVTPKSASKIAIAAAVSKRFNVKVENVNTVNIKGKAKNALVKRGTRSIKGERSDFKKAYVKLAKGQSIALFEQPKSSTKASPKVKTKREKA